MQDRALHSLETFRIDTGSLVDPTAPILAKAQQIDAMKSGCVNHVAFGPDVPLRPFIRQFERNSKVMMIGHDLAGGCHAERYDSAEARAGLNWLGHNNAKPWLHHLGLFEAAVKIHPDD